MPKMVLMQNSGVRIEVPENRMDFYLRAGYVVVSDKPEVKPTQPEEWEPEESSPPEEAVEKTFPAKKHKKG